MEEVQLDGISSCSSSGSLTSIMLEINYPDFTAEKLLYSDILGKGNFNLSNMKFSGLLCPSLLPVELYCKLNYKYVPFLN